MPARCLDLAVLDNSPSFDRVMILEQRSRKVSLSLTTGIGGGDQYGWVSMEMDRD